MCTFRQYVDVSNAIHVVGTYASTSQTIACIAIECTRNKKRKKRIRSVAWHALQMGLIVESIMRSLCANYTIFCIIIYASITDCLNEHAPTV